MVKEGSGETARPVIEVTINGEAKRMSPEMISAAVLSKMKETAEAVLSPATVDKAVVTVPAYFHEPQKVATIQAAKIAGLTGECAGRRGAQRGCVGSAARLHARHRKHLMPCATPVLSQWNARSTSRRPLPSRTPWTSAGR